MNSAPFHDNLSRLDRPSLMRALPGARPDWPAQSEFDFEGLPHAYPLLYVEEAAGELSCSDQHIRNLIDEGALLAFPINIETNALKRRRNIYRVVRSTCVRDQHLTASGATDLMRSVHVWLLPSSLGSRSVLTIYETATALRCTGIHVRALYDAALLRGVDISSGRTPVSGVAAGVSPGAPKHLRIARESLVTFVLTRLARQNNIQL